MSLSLRAYAAHRKAMALSGTTHQAVRAAIESGRLLKSVTKDGQIRSAELADREWAATTREDRVPLSGPTAPKSRARKSRGDGGDVPDLQEARARREMALARIAELELAELEGGLVPVDEARAYMIDKFTIVKTRLLAVPSKLAQRLPPEKRDLAVLQLVDDLIREALEELANDDEDEELDDEDDDASEAEP